MLATIVIESASIKKGRFMVLVTIPYVAENHIYAASNYNFVVTAGISLWYTAPYSIAG